MAENRQFQAFLTTNPLFAGLGADVIEHVAKLCVPRRVDANAVLFSKGDEGDALYAVRRGQIRIGIGTEDGKRLTLATLGTGDVFGEIALLDGQPRTADAVAAETSELFMVRRRDFVELLRGNGAIALRVIEMLCGRLRSSNDRMEEAVLMPLDVRLARRIAALAADFGNELEISQEQLAVMVGSTRETVNRQLQIWRRVGIVELKRSRIILRDAERLDDHAQASTKPV
jgi:CRP/FNR family transcriptional regulator, cyclic AMP receptor protein